MRKTPSKVDNEGYRVGQSQGVLHTMSLERHGSRSYFYFVRRENGKLIKRYVACGDAAISAAREIEEARQSARQGRAAILEAEKRMGETCRALDLLAHATLESAGFHQVKRVWRRRRHGKCKQSSDT